MLSSPRRKTSFSLNMNSGETGLPPRGLHFKATMRALRIMEMDTEAGEVEEEVGEEVVVEEGAAAEAEGGATKVEEAETETELTRTNTRAVTLTTTANVATTRRWPELAGLRNLFHKCWFIVAISRMQRCPIA